MISKRDEEKLKEKSLTPEQLAEIYEKTSDTLTTLCIVGWMVISQKRWEYVGNITLMVV